MNVLNSLNFLYSLQKFGIKLGLENTYRLLELVGNPHSKFKAIHIAGTNGKGSTASLIASVLSEFGFKVGLYTSPHLIRFNERIRVDDKEILDEELIHYVDLFRDKILEIKPTFFEATTCIAFKYFADKDVDYAVIETGLGGRLDSTNVIIPQISVITKISYDHKDILGETIDKIAFEKAGIIKNNIPVVLAKNQEEAKSVIRRIAQEKKSELIEIEKFYSSEIISTKQSELKVKINSTLTNNSYEINSPLLGKYQVDNLCNVIATIEKIFPDADIKDKIISGVEKYKFKMKGRFQVIQTKPQIILDTAHNSDAIQNFLEELNKYSSLKRKIAIFGIMKDKEFDEVIDNIEKSFDKIILTQAQTERSLSSNDLQRKFFMSIFKTYLTQSVSEAISTSFQLAKEEDLIVIFGSNYIVGEALEFFDQKN